MRSVDEAPGAAPSAGAGMIADALEAAAEAERHDQRIRESLDIEMRDVKDGVLRMGSYVEEQILAAHDAIMNRDAALAAKVIAADGRVNEVQRAVSGIVAMTIATQAPVARDLRFLLALDRVTYELERIGDHAGSAKASITRCATSRTAS